MNRIMQFFKDEQGVTAVEYAIMVALVAAVVIAGATILGRETNNKLTDVGNAIGGMAGS